MALQELTPPVLFLGEQQLELSVTQNPALSCTGLRPQILLPLLLKVDSPEYIARVGWEEGNREGGS